MHKVRPARREDLPEILRLGRQFGHQMLYQTVSELMEKCLPRLIVTEAEKWAIVEENPIQVVTGYYHYIVSGDPGFIETLQCWKQMPKNLLLRAAEVGPKELCVMMQGGCHREDFNLLVSNLQERYPIIWCWNSITDPTRPSGKINGYKALGFIYDDQYISTFFNVNKGGISTYQLGYWVR